MLDLLTSLLEFLPGSALGHAVRSVEYLYPSLESIQILAIALLVGPAFIIDMRTLGAGHRTVSVTTAARYLLPVSRIGFAIAVLTGLAMLSVQATVVAGSGAAPWKLGLLILACLNVLVFHYGIYRHVDEWTDASRGASRRPHRGRRVTDRMDRRDLRRPAPCVYVISGGRPVVAGGGH